MALVSPRIKEVLEEFGEADVLVDEILRRRKKGLYTLILTNGLPGTGKSWLNLRLKEVIEEKIKEKYKVESIKEPIACDSLLDLIKCIRECPVGSVVPPIEELSVMAPSKRAMSSDNVSLGQILDTVRKRKLILISNAPILKSIDKHIVAMSNYLVETKEVDKNQGLTKSKVLRLQTNVRSGVTYFHTLRRRKTGKDVNFMFTTKPSDSIIELYEKSKDDFMEGLYEKLQAKAEKKREKEAKELGLSTGKVKAPEPLTPHQKLILNTVQELPEEQRTVKVLSQKLKMLPQHIVQGYTNILSKGYECEILAK